MYNRTFTISLLPTSTGLALQAQLKDTAGANSGSAVTTGFAVIGLGQYTWTASLDPAFAGCVVIATQAAPTVPLCSEAINPPDPTAATIAAAVAAPSAATIAAAVAVPSAVAIRTEIDANSTKLANAVPTAATIAAAVAAPSAATIAAAVAAPSVTAIRTEIDANSTKLANAVPTVLAIASAVAVAVDAPSAEMIAATVNAPSAAAIASAVAAPSAADIDEQLSASHGPGPWASPTSGAQVYTVTDAATGNPVAGVNIRITTDAAGFNEIAIGLTNGQGQFSFFHGLASGTALYVWREKAGCAFSNPVTEVLP
jgi:hypothetical protein